VKTGDGERERGAPGGASRGPGARAPRARGGRRRRGGSWSMRPRDGQNVKTGEHEGTQEHEGHEMLILCPMTCRFNLDDFVGPTSRNAGEPAGRRPAACDAALGERIAGRDVLVTGGGGTIGAAYAKAVLRYPVRSLTVVDLNENGLTSSCATCAARPATERVWLGFGSGTGGGTHGRGGQPRRAGRSEGRCRRSRSGTRGWRVTRRGAGSPTAAASGADRGSQARTPRSNASTPKWPRAQEARERHQPVCKARAVSCRSEFRVIRAPNGSGRRASTEDLTRCLPAAGQVDTSRPALVYHHPPSSRCS